MSRRLSRHLLFASILAATAVAPAAALEYPCPSDPGFCYRDVGDDGCFDAGTDEGPIDAEIEGSSVLPPAPPPGSLVCPPSVVALGTSFVDMRLATPSGSSVLFYAAAVSARTLEIVSGGQILMGGPIAGLRSVRLSASSEARIEEDVRVFDSRGDTPTSEIRIESASGDLRIEEKVRLSSPLVFLVASTGDIDLFAKGKVRAVARRGADVANVEISAAGAVRLHDTAVRAVGEHSFVDIHGATLSLLGKVKVKAKAKSSLVPHVDIGATSGDLSIERITLKTASPVTLSGNNVDIGVFADGKTRRSRIVQSGDAQPVEILSTGDMEIHGLIVSSTSDVLFDATGSSLLLVDGVLRGKKTGPTFTVSAGVGSTCDLSGTVVKKAVLATSCDVVIGP